jgi:hypothetical protein
MSIRDSIAHAEGNGRQAPAQARRLAGRLSVLFEQDSLIVGRQNDAQRRLAQANERLWSGLHPEAFGLIYDGAAPASHSQIAALIDASPGGRPASQTAVLRALQEAHWAIGRAFHAYQNASEERRQLAADVGELTREFVGALTQAGWTEDQARNADVHQLAGSAERIAGREEPGR